MNPGLLLLLLGGVYLLYQASQTPTTTTTTTSAPPQTGGTPAGGRVPVNVTTSQPSAPPPPSTAGSLSGALASLTALETSMVGVDPAIQGSQLVASYDVHNYYLGQVLGTTNLPDSGTTMGAKGTVPVLSLPQYWGVIAPWLAANRGMSGTGKSKIRVRVPATMSKGWR